MIEQLNLNEIACIAGGKKHAGKKPAAKPAAPAGESTAYWFGKQVFKAAITFGPLVGAIALSPNAVRKRVRVDSDEPGFGMNRSPFISIGLAAFGGAMVVYNYIAK